MAPAVARTRPLELWGASPVVEEARRWHRDGSVLEPTARRAARRVRVGELGAGRGRGAPAEVLPLPPAPRGSRALARACGAQGGRPPRARTLAGGDSHTGRPGSRRFLILLLTQHESDFAFRKEGFDPVLESRLGPRTPLS